MPENRRTWDVNEHSNGTTDDTPYWLYVGMKTLFTKDDGRVIGARFGPFSTLVEMEAKATSLDPDCYVVLGQMLGMPGIDLQIG